MSSPPGPEVFRPQSNPPIEIGAADVVSFANALLGLLRPLSVLDRLVHEVKASFGPAPVAAVTVDEQGNSESANGDAAHPEVQLLLNEVLLTGQPVLRKFELGTGLAVPLNGRRSLLGALGMVLEHSPSQRDLAMLRTLAAITAVALEGTRLVAVANQERERWEEAMDSVSLALCLVDRAGRVDRGNRGFAALLSLPVTGLTGRSLLSLVPEPWREGIAGLIKEPGPEEIELTLEARTIAVTAFRIAAGDPGRMVFLFEDQTDRRRLQERLIQSEKLTAIGQLIAGVAHDLNNPLTSVVGFADFLAESAEVPPRILEPLRVIQQEAERASKIVKNLLSFARRQETRQRASLRPILEATIGLFQGHLNADRVALVADLQPDLPMLSLNPNQIQQVFVNLIQNAAQAIMASGRAGTVRLTARRWMDGVAVDIVDDGTGMSTEVAARVFEPFFTTKPEGQGTGLGLSISQGIVKEHGGRITVSSRFGSGSSFTVELPGQVLLPAPAVAGVSPAASRPLAVLVVDDEPHILHYIRATLEAWGHTVATAGDGHAALERATSEPFDLIISDLRMPRLGGREFFEQLSQRAPQAAHRVAFSTGDTVRGDTLDFLESTGRPCLQKPFSLAELRALLRDASV